MIPPARQSDSDSSELPPQVAGILGLGMLPEDGQDRISKGPFFQLFQGSAESHEAMLELCLALQEALDARGMQLQDLTRDELLDVMSELPWRQQD